MWGKIIWEGNRENEGVVELYIRVVGGDFIKNERRCVSKNLRV